jgi:hypothetical protein
MEYEYLFSKNLREALKAKIKASIYCKVIGNVLIIIIKTKDMNFEYAIENFSDKLRMGELTHESIIEEIETKYKRKVLNTYFVY